MKKFIILCLSLLFKISVFAQYNYQNIHLLSRFDDNTVVSEPKIGLRYSSVWAYYDSLKKREYAILGSTKGTHFIDVTDSKNPVQKAFVSGRRDSCIWREYKTYKNYLYTVSDDQNPNSLQIIDLKYLPDSVHVVFDSDTIFSRSHTVFVEGDKLYCGSVTTSLNAYYSMAVYSLENPEHPVLLRTLNQDYPEIKQVHDMFVRKDTVFASCGYDGLNVYKLNQDNKFVLLGSLTSYPQQGYNHSSTLSKNGKTLVFCDEVPKGQDVKIIDVSQLDDIKVLKTFHSSEGATPHNPYFKGDNVYISYYKDGLQVFNVKDRLNPVRTAFFDTYPDNGNDFSDYPYSGCWGAYVDLPSGIILASDMQKGLFVLNDRVVDPPVTSDIKYLIAPNPIQNTLNVFFEKDAPLEIEITISDLRGNTCYKQKKVWEITDKKISLDLNLANGIYFVVIQSDIGTRTFKIIK